MSAHTHARTRTLSFALALALVLVLGTALVSALLAYNRLRPEPFGDPAPRYATQATDATYAPAFPREAATLTAFDVRRDGTFATPTDVRTDAAPRFSYVDAPPTPPTELPLRSLRPLDWNCQRPWWQCCGPD
jgi:hypothetical protein